MNNGNGKGATRDVFHGFF